MRSDSEWSAITKYLSGECTPEERKRIEAWLDDDPERRARLEELRAVWDATDADPASRDVDAAWQQVERRLNPEPDQNESTAPPASRARRTPRHRSGRSRTRTRIIVSVAAACVLAAAALTLLQDPTRSPTEAPDPRVVSTEPGERTTVSLADGSSVMLNADSRLTVAAAYGDERRFLRLDGEAYFEVEPGSPFVVETKTARVRVVGTSFGVRSYEQEEILSVVVTEGTVGVNPEGDATPERTLGRKQRAVVSSSGEVNVTSDVALDSHLAWREGRLVFNSTPLPDIIDDLERQYGLGIALLDSELADRRLTTTFESQSLGEVLDVVALSLDLGYRRTDSTVVFGRSDRPDFHDPSASESRPQ